MSWMQNKVARLRPLLAPVVAVGLASGGFWAVSAQAATIVVRSNGPSAGAFPVGKSLAAGAAIVLKAGDVITVLDAGGTRVLRGPGRIAVSGAGAANVNGIAALIADTGARQTRTGATRGSSAAAPHPTNLWYVDIAKGGNVCVSNVKALALWRARSDQAASLTIVPTGAPRVQIDFRPGQAVAAWPAALPVGEGSRFRLESAVPAHAGVAPVTIVTRLLSASPGSLDSAARALLDHGCAAQVDTLVAATTADPGS